MHVGLTRKVVHVPCSSHVMKESYFYSRSGIKYRIIINIFLIISGLPNEYSQLVPGQWWWRHLPGRTQAWLHCSVLPRKVAVWTNLIYILCGQKTTIILYYFEFLWEGKYLENISILLAWFDFCSILKLANCYYPVKDYNNSL